MSRDAFELAARNVDDVMFAYSTSPAVAAKYGVAAPALRMAYPHDEQASTFNGDLQNVEDMEKFVKSYKLPLVVTFNGEMSAALFGDGRPLLFLFRDKNEKGDAAEKAIRDAAPVLKRRLAVAIAGIHEPMDQRLMDYVGVEPDHVPTVRLVANPMAVMTKYKMEGEISTPSIVSFAEAFEAARLRPHMRSEDAPAVQSGPVHVLVGSTFEAVVKDSKKDVMVVFYAPWCGHSKRLEPLYKQVAEKLLSVKSLVLAKIDATANDVEGFHIEGFPTIKFWAADKKGEAPIDFDSDRDLESFIDWLEAKSHFKFEGKNLKTEL
jgi:protein disulfide-isomerase A1